MTDEPTPDAAPPPDETPAVDPAPEPQAAEAPRSPGSQPPPDATSAPAPWEPPASAPPGATKRSGRGRTILIVAVIAVFVAGVLYVVRNNAAADDLKVGECFDVPSQTTVQTVDRHPCTEPHGAEVIFVGEYTGGTYPISASLDSYIEERCVPAFESYVGQDIDSQQKLSIGYFYPSPDSWDSGDRTVTCYVLNTDASPMMESVKGA